MRPHKLIKSKDLGHNLLETRQNLIMNARVNGVIPCVQFQFVYWGNAELENVVTTNSSITRRFMVESDEYLRPTRGTEEDDREALGALVLYTTWTIDNTKLWIKARKSTTF